MSQKTAEDPPAQPSSLHLLLSFLAILAVYLIYRPGQGTFSAFPDARVCAYAFHDWFSGKNPYDAHNGGLYFVYPPLFLYVGAFLARLLPQGWGWILYIAIYLSSVLALPAILCRYYFRQPWLNQAFTYLIFLAVPGFATIFALLSGNISCLLYLLIFAAALPGVRKNRWELFYLAVFVAANIKITFVLMLFLPIFAGEWQLLRSLFCLASVITSQVLQKIFMPHMYADYRHSLANHVIGENQYGYGIFGIAAGQDYKLHHAVGMVPYIIAVLVAIAIFCSLALLRRRAGLKSANGAWLALVIVAVVIANPRILSYEVYFGLAAALVLLIWAFNSRWPLLWMLCLFLLPQLLSLAGKDRHTTGPFTMLILLVAFAAAYRKLWLVAKARQVAEHALVPSLD
jgi:hypothetical protein